MQTVAIYCSNLMISAIGAILQKQPDLKTQKLEKWEPDAVQNLETAPPAVILFDLTANSPDFTISVLQNNPETRLIGIDLASHQMLVISGVRSQLLTADDLVQLLGSSECLNMTANPVPEAGADIQTVVEGKQTEQLIQK